MAFSIEDAEDRFTVQGNRCALCGKELVFENSDQGDRGAWHAHHIDGNPENDDIDNCACVCINDPNCHLNIAHGGEFNNGPLAPHRWFRLDGWTEIELNEIERIKRIYRDVGKAIIFYHDIYSSA